MDTTESTTTRELVEVQRLAESIAERLRLTELLLGDWDEDSSDLRAILEWDEDEYERHDCDAFGMFLDYESAGWLPLIDPRPGDSNSGAWRVEFTICGGGPSAWVECASSEGSWVTVRACWGRESVSVKQWAPHFTDRTDELLHDVAMANGYGR